MQYKHIWKLFEVGCLYQDTVTALYGLGRNEKLLKIFVWPSSNHVFYRPERNF